MLTEAERATIEKLLLRDRENALDALGHFDERAEDLRDRAGEMSLYRFHMADVGSEAQEQEKEFLLASQEGRRLYQIDEALRRLYREPEKFGTCGDCGQPIGFARLEVVPEAVRCSACQSAVEAA